MAVIGMGSGLGLSNGNGGGGGGNSLGGVGVGGNGSSSVTSVGGVQSPLAEGNNYVMDPTPMAVKHKSYNSQPN